VQDIKEELSRDVRKQLHTILDLLKDLDAEGGNSRVEKPVGREQMEVLEQFIASDLPVQLLAQLSTLEFEARKDVMNLSCALLWPSLPEEICQQVIDYLRYHPRVFELLVRGYSNEEAALHCGVVLRSFFRKGELVEAFLTSGQIFELIRFASHPCIDVSADAIYTLRKVMLEHKEVSGPWLNANNKEYWSFFNTLLESEDYCIERQALTLLAGMLLDAHFQKAMIDYVNNVKHLQLIMNLLRDDSPTIQAEAFHAFKIFVVNPKKPVKVHQILVKNKDKLILLLQSLHAVRTDDANFAADQQKVINRLLAMPARVSSTPATSNLSRTNSSVSMATTCDTTNSEAPEWELAVKRGRSAALAGLDRSL